MDSTREERRRAGRTTSVKCTEAIVGDETGSIVLTTRQQEKVDVLKKGAYLALLNVYVEQIKGLSPISMNVQQNAPSARFILA